MGAPRHNPSRDLDFGRQVGREAPDLTPLERCRQAKQEARWWCDPRLRAKLWISRGVIPKSQFSPCASVQNLRGVSRARHSPPADRGAEWGVEGQVVLGSDTHRGKKEPGRLGQHSPGLH